MKSKFLHLHLFSALFGGLLAQIRALSRPFQAFPFRQLTFLILQKINLINSYVDGNFSFISCMGYDFKVVVVHFCRDEFCPVFIAVFG